MIAAESGDGWLLLRFRCNVKMFHHYDEAAAADDDVGLIFTMNCRGKREYTGVCLTILGELLCRGLCVFVDGALH